MQEKSYSKKSYSDNTLEEESISLLEWDSLKTHLSSFSSTEMGKRAILSFGIPSEYEASKRLLNETIEINELENNLEKLISFSGVFDISKNILICSKGGVISSSELLEIAKTIAAARNLKKIILGPFKSELNPIGIMSPKFVSKKIYDLANSKNYLIIISPNPLSYLLFPLKEFFNFLYCQIIYKYKS